MNGAWAGFVFIVLGLGLVGAAMVCDLRRPALLRRRGIGRYVDRDSQPAEFPAPDDPVPAPDDEKGQSLPVG